MEIKQEEEMTQSITNIFSRESYIITQTQDECLLTVPLSQLLRRSVAYKEAWVRNVNQAIEVHHLEVERRLRELRNMRELLRQWLRTPRT
jgi:hypothetical protein